MQRYIRIDENNKITQVRTGETIVEGEIQSDTGECGDIMQPDGTFITPEPEPYIPPPNPLEERVEALETLVLQLGGVI